MVKQNKMKQDWYETKIQSDICACAFRPSCARLSKREHVLSTNQLRRKVDQLNDPCGVEKCHPTPAVHIYLLFHQVSSIQLAVQP